MEYLLLSASIHPSQKFQFCKADSRNCSVMMEVLELDIFLITPVQLLSFFFFFLNEVPVLPAFSCHVHLFLLVWSMMALPTLPSACSGSTRECPPHVLEDVRYLADVCSSDYYASSAIFFTYITEEKKNFSPYTNPQTG